MELSERLSDFLFLLCEWLGKPAVCKSEKSLGDFVASLWKSLGDVPIKLSSSSVCNLLGTSAGGVTAPWRNPGRVGL